MTGMEKMAVQPMNEVIAKRGQLVEIVYPVWTSKGVDFLRKKLNIKK